MRAVVTAGARRATSQSILRKGVRRQLSVGGAGSSATTFGALVQTSSRRSGLPGQSGARDVAVERHLAAVVGRHRVLRRAALEVGDEDGVRRDDEAVDLAGDVDSRGRRPCAARPSTATSARAPGPNSGASSGSAITGERFGDEAGVRGLGHEPRARGEEGRGRRLAFGGWMRGSACSRRCSASP